ncbi:TadE family type IV pilus minor pilin [Bifidobacterium stellenboschense]|uniref:Pilus biosynthesis protein TadE n=1 Tax=Bifidobacterium stellenboschense TaxID=762211 RepID=A0A087DN93_9BIFI|nr:TadE family type IV pilus minor pilin [Bifidobacterium stellenboschense]KFI96993.1 pilus biosynthesis protein TadE [Bifidobacterium stellenboschense]
MIARYSRRRARRPPPDKAADPGAVTAEFATVLPAVVALALLLLALSRTVMVSIGCQDAASAAARTVVAAGDAADPASAAHAVGGGDITVQVSRDGDRVTVTTHCPVIPDPLGVLPTRVEGRAVGVIA